MEDAFAVKEESLRSCELPASLFELIESVWEGDNDQPLHRFCSLMRKMKAKSFVQEELILNQELQDEKSMLDVHFGLPINLEATRLTFFCHLTDSKKWNNDDLADNHILGYAIIVKIHLPDGNILTHLLEAVVRPPSVVFPSNGEGSYFIESITNYYLHNVKLFKTCLGTAKKNRLFPITGSFFTQQNYFTSVCAHACLRMAMNSSPVINCKKLTNKEINDILGISNYKIDGGGLSQDQIISVVNQMGCKCHSANFTSQADIEYDHFMYPSLESCFPTILGIEYWDKKEQRVSGHVVTVLGHTINSDRWEPEAVRVYGGYPLKPYIPTAEWCDHYIISDDNYGMHSTLPTDAIRNFIVPTKNPNRHVSMAISIVPDNVTLPGYTAEQFAVDVATKLINSIGLKKPNIWHERLKEKNLKKRKQSLVCRTLLQKKCDYVNSIKAYVQNLTPEQQSCLDSLPDYMWVSEISLPNVYTANKHKLGDVVLRADATRDECMVGKSLVLAWFPGFVQIGGPRFNIQAWDIQTHVPLIRNAEDSVLEW